MEQDGMETDTSLSLGKSEMEMNIKSFSCLDRGKTEKSLLYNYFFFFYKMD